MIVEIGRLSFYDGQKDIFVGDKEVETSNENAIILTDKDVDAKWLKKICDSAEVDFFGRYKANNVECKYILLYLIFSTRKRIFFEDIINIGERTELFQPKGAEFNTQEYYWEKLNEFMVSHGYEYKLLKGNTELYRGAIKIPWNTYKSREWLSIAGVKVIAIRGFRFFVHRWLHASSFLKKKLAAKGTKKHLDKEFDKNIQMNPKSHSGCLFYKSMNENERWFFVKSGTILGADIADEYMSAKRVFERTFNRSLYLLPLYPDSKENRLIFDFEENQVTLGQILKKRQMEAFEFDLLSDYFLTVLRDLKECHVIHRDIHMDNILVQLNDEENIVSYKLIDFGCACIDEKVINNGVRDKRKNKYAGNIYRYSANAWNDAASALFILLQIANINFDLYRGKLNEIEKIIGENYTVYSA